MIRTSVPLLSLLIVTLPAVSQQTVAEKTDYRATSRYADVVAFGEDLAKKSPRVHAANIGKTGEGRTLPLLVLADPPITSPEEAQRSGKLVVMAFANIHAGEVDGKEALLMLARDIVTGADSALLKDLIVLIVPILNADGNERIDKAHRREQNGPADGVGIRENAAGFDLNRDFVKLETSEVRGLVKAITRWDPAVIVDMHTTNGSYHRYTLTYDGPRHPGANPPLIATVRDKWLPEIGAAMEKATGYKSFYYGDFSADHTAWETYPALPRFGLQSIALRNRVGVLSESYTYAPFKDRVLVGQAFARGILVYVAAHRAEVKSLIDAASRNRDRVPLRTKTVAQGPERTALGYVEEMKDGKTVPTQKTKDYPVRYLGGVEATLEVQRPFAYLLPASFTTAIETLQRHGIEVEELREDIELDLQVYTIESVSKAKNLFQKHNLVHVEVARRDEARKMTAGTVLVRTEQKLGNLAAYLLEPQAEDGLMAWNAFDSALAEGKEFPVLRLPKSVPLTRGPVRPLADDRPMGKAVTPDVLLGKAPPNFNGTPIGDITWLDGEHFLQVKDNRLWKIAASTGRAEPFVDIGKLAASIATLPALKPEEADGIARGPFYLFNPLRTAILFTHGDELYSARIDGTRAVRLTKSPGKKEVPSFSPDGRFVAFVRGGNLFVVDVETQAERQLTSDGGGQILNGLADWVYGEEIFNRHPQAYWWSPDGRRIAFLRFDDSPVAGFTVLDHIPTRQKVERISYPKAGDPNPIIKLGVVPVAGGEPNFADQANYSPGDSIVARVGWLPDSTKVYAYWQNRAQTWLDFCTMPSEGGPLIRLFRETTKAWVEDLGEPTFLPDGTFLLASEVSGWKHLYAFDAAGRRGKAITQGEWEIHAVQTTDLKDGCVYFTATKDGHTAINLYRCKFDGTALERLTIGGGSHAVSVAPTGKLFVDRHSDSATPRQTRLWATGGAAIRTLDSNPVHVREEYRVGLVERVQVKTKDGFVLEGTLVKPADFDPAKRYPVWVMTYAGPHAATVHDGWDGRLFDHALAGAGVVVFHIDPRSASGKGACSAWTAYRQLGVQELKDGIRERGDRHCRKAQHAPERARHVRTRDRGQAK